MRKELNIFSLIEKINLYRNKWESHLERVDNTRILLSAHQYQPQGMRNVGCQQEGGENTPKFRALMTMIIGKFVISLMVLYCYRIVRCSAKRLVRFIMCSLARLPKWRPLVRYYVPGRTLTNCNYFVYAEIAQRFPRY